jgi:hypothetical protein
MLCGEGSETMQRHVLRWSALLLTAGACALTSATAEPPENLLEGAAWRYGDESEAGDGVATAWTGFELDDPSALGGLELAHSLRPGGSPTFLLNGKEVTGPLEGMFYRAIPAIDPRLLKPGRNMLMVRYRPSADPDGGEAWTMAGRAALLALTPEHLGFRTQPILGPVSADGFTLTCRTNLPALCVLRGEVLSESTEDKREFFVNISAGRLRHRWRVHSLKAGWRVRYTITAQYFPWGAEKAHKRAVASRSHVVSANPPDGRLRFAVCGDTRSRPEQWAKVAAAIVNAKPDLVVHSGDMVAQGVDDWQWDAQFFRPARGLFGAIPFYAVIGNHEMDAPLYDELFLPPQEGGGRNWTQQIDGVRLIGIDALDDWSPDSPNARWLEQVLAGEPATRPPEPAEEPKFTFLVSHYPAWTSGPHGRLNDAGKPREEAIRQAREVIVPLLVKYGATAMITGHDHLYERSELPGGLTHIIAAGGGAPLYRPVDNAGEQNPYSKAVFSTLHYCLFTVAGDACRMEAVTPDGQVLDTKLWRAR